MLGFGQMLPGSQTDERYYYKQHHIIIIIIRIKGGQTDNNFSFAERSCDDESKACVCSAGARGAAVLL